MTIMRMQGVVRRPSLPLTEQDMRDLVQLRESAAYRAALGFLIGSEVDESASEGVLLHGVFEAGLLSVREAAEAAGYNMIALDQADHAKQRAIARRRPPSWADEP